MSETLASGTGIDTTAVSPSTGGSATGAAAGVATPAAATTPAAPIAAGEAGQATPADGAAAKKPREMAGRANQVQRAHARAAEKLSAARKAAQQAAQPSVDAQQAGGGNQAATGTDEGGKPTTTAAEAKAGTDGAAPGAPPASTPGNLDAPADWPEKQRAEFGKLPDEARQTVLGFYRDMQAGFTRATQKLAAERDSLGELVATRDAFARDPKGTLAQLAKNAGVEIFFDRPLPAGQLPEFKDAAEMARWVTEQVAQEATKARTAERAQSERAQAMREAQDAVTRELGEAKAKFADFDTHRAAVFGVLERAPGLKVEEAYQLATYANLLKGAGQADALRREIVTLKAELEKRAKLATAPPALGLNGKSKEDLSHMSPGQRAYKRAQARLATAS